MAVAYEAAVRAVAEAIHSSADGCDHDPALPVTGCVYAARQALAALATVPDVRAALVEARAWPCSLCRGTGTFEYDSDCGDSGCDAPHPTKRVKCRTCSGAGFTPIGATAADAILAALRPPEAPDA